MNIKSSVTLLPKLQKLIKKKENLLNDLKAKSSRNDLKGIWQAIKLATNLPTKSNSQGLTVDENSNALSLNDHFCNIIGPKLKESIPI